MTYCVSSIQKHDLTSAWVATCAPCHLFITAVHDIHASPVHHYYTCMQLTPGMPPVVLLGNQDQYPQNIVIP